MDRIIFGYAFDGKLRFSVARTTSTVEEARLRHNLSPIVTAALGRLITGAALTTPWLSETEVITFTIESRGPIGRLVAQARNFTVRGYVSNPTVDTVIKDGKFDIASVIAGGTLNVVRDLGLKAPYTSQVPLQTGEIAEDIAYYYAKSEQLPTAMSLGVKVGKKGVIQAGGYALQILDKSISDKAVENLERAVNSLGSVTELYQDGYDEVDILKQLLGDNLGYYEEHTVEYKCKCSKEKAKSSLLVLELKDLNELLKEGFAEVTCKWCGKKYIFGEKDIKEVIIGK